MKDFTFLFTPWWGKVIGLILGYLTAGSAGAVFGIIIGNIFDIGLNNILQTPQWHHYRRASPNIKAYFLPMLFQVMGHIAKVDGQINASDIKIARKIMRELRLFKADKQQAMKYYNQGKSEHFPFENNLRKVKQLCYYNPNLLALFSETQYRVACITPISNGKKDKINVVYNLLGYHDIFPERASQKAYAKANHATDKSYQTQHKSYKKTRQRYQKKQTDYEILGIQNGERADVVKKAYRKLISKIHPDKLIARNASDEEIDNATEQSQNLRAAYERIKKSRGF
tara:strand:- start:189 stop:1040 length:852 start_codon:yes stop_codon:yes gene_type:complete